MRGYRTPVQADPLAVQDDGYESDPDRSKWKRSGTLAPAASGTLPVKTYAEPERRIVACGADSTQAVRNAPTFDGKRNSTVHVTGAPEVLVTSTSPMKLSW
jgi:hypothetical protein